MPHLKRSMSEPKPRRRRPHFPQVAFRIPPEWIEEFEEHARKSGYRFNRSDFLREAAEEWLRRNRGKLK